MALNLPGVSFSFLASLAPALLALVVAGGGAFLSRWRAWLMPASGAAAAVAGWAALYPGSWRWVLWPRSTAECLVLPALVFLLAELLGQRIRARVIGFAAICFAAWWLAWSPAGRVEFWRVEFGAVLVVVALGRVGAGRARLALAVGLTGWGGLLASGAPGVWAAAMAVLAAIGVGTWSGRRDGTVPPGVLMLGLVGADLGGGRLIRGGIGMVDLVCVGAIAAPLAVPWVERALRSRLRGMAGVGSVVGVSAATVGVAWVVNLALRGAAM